MAKSSRASVVKKNNQRLKKNVFGPVEAARNERLSAKLLELANQPKPPRTEMEVEPDETRNAAAAAGAKDEDVDVDVDMDADESSQSAAQRKQQTSAKKQRGPRSPRIEKKKTRRRKNSVVFPTHPKKVKRGT